MTAPQPRRPRFLLFLALVGFVFGTMNVVTSLSTFVTLTGSHDAFSNEVRRESARLVAPAGTKDAASNDELQAISVRKAEALWSRRGVLLPLAVANLIAAALILAGCVRMWRSPAGRVWGRSAWQLGCLVALPCVALQTLVEIAHVRDLAAALSDLNGPFATQLKDTHMATMVVWGRSVTAALYLFGVAAYLNGRPVREWTGEA